MSKRKTRTWDSLKRVAVIGSYLPRRCGIATFSKDTVDSLVAASDGKTEVWAVAMNDRPEGYRYPQDVKFEINETRIADYKLAADFLNMSKVDVVSLQHEYGIFGGDYGVYVLDLIRRLRAPVVTTLHTVLKEPDEGQYKTMLKLAEASDRMIVLSETGRQFMQEVYGIGPDKVTHIGHGIPDVPFVDPNYYKDQFGVEGRRVILTFGLLSPGKGIEYMIEAMPEVVEKYPDAVYMVLGATHPGVLAHQGEEYRNGLKRRVAELNLQDHVMFINKFVELQELCEFLGCADVYVTPYLGEGQIVSGTLAYALGAGKAVISTPYYYATEMLDGNRGICVPFRDSQTLSHSINHLFENEIERHAMRKKAYAYTRQLVWSSSGASYLDLFADVQQEREKSPKPSFVVHHHQKKIPHIEELSEIKLDHLMVLTDDTGVFKHAKYTVPDRTQGYRTDDNARALITVMMARDHLPSGTGCTRLATRYLSFLDDAWDPKTGRFRNHLSFDRVWHEEIESEDCHGRALWALGMAVAHSQSRGHIALAQNLFHQGLPAMETLASPSAWAYGLIGIHGYLRRFSGDSAVRRLREQLAAQLFHAFEENATDDWLWLSPILTWGNARLPHALLLSGRWMFHNEMIDYALRVLEWLWSVETSQDPNGNTYFAPIGTHGWLTHGSPDGKARFDQPPLEASCMIDACLEAHRVTTDRKWLDRAFLCLNWYLGENDLRLPLYDPSTGGCADGLRAQGINENQGAEATLAWLLSLVSMYDHSLETLEGPAADEARANKIEKAPPTTSPASSNTNSTPNTNTAATSSTSATDSKDKNVKTKIKARKIRPSASRASSKSTNAPNS